MATAPTRLRFFGDPCCPWTWNTSRWLIEIADRHGVAIEWRTLCLAELNRDREVSEHFRPRMDCSRRMGRIFEWLRAEEATGRYARLFTEYGTRIHHDGREPDAELMAESAVAAGLDLEAANRAADDPEWDAAISRSVTEAMDSAGPEVGSPILVNPATGLGFFGPIVSPPPTGGDADRLWTVVSTAMSVPGFFELKRGRRDGVVFGPHP